VFCILSFNGLVPVLNDYNAYMEYLYKSVYYIFNTNGVCFRSEHLADGYSAGDNMTDRDECNH
jgi:hypothetical protein